MAVLAVKDLQTVGGRMLRDLVSEIRTYLYLTEQWFVEELAEADPASEDELNAILYANSLKLQDLLGISSEQLHTLLDNYDLLCVEIRNTMSADTEQKQEEGDRG